MRDAAAAVPGPEGVASHDRRTCARVSVAAIARLADDCPPDAEVLSDSDYSVVCLVRAGMRAAPGDPEPEAAASSGGRKCLEVIELRGMSGDKSCCHRVN